MNAEREPIFNAPWPPVALTAAIILGYLLQTTTPWGEASLVYAFSPVEFEAGRWTTLFTALFIHGSWGHALMNAAFALAFGTPLARYLGTRAAGSVAFFAFYLACGALSSAAYGALHAGEPILLAGASGAVSGLAGVAARLIAGRGEMGKVLSPTVIGMGGAWLIINLLTAIIGFAPGAGYAQVAWEAHIAGFAAGVALSPALAALRRPDP